MIERNRFKQKLKLSHSHRNVMANGKYTNARFALLITSQRIKGMVKMKLRTIHGHKIRERRKMCGLTLQQLADKALTTKSYIWEMENKSGKPSVFMALKLAKALGTTVEELFDPDHFSRLGNMVESED